MKFLLLFFIRIYQLCIAPFIGPVCRFYPSCSCYAHEAVATHGVIKGGWLTIKRLSKCQGWHPGGYDPPPTKD